MECIIDRFEGNYAVVEYKETTFNFPKVLLPSEAKEGHVINVEVSINVEKTKKLKKEVDQLMEDVWS